MKYLQTNATMDMELSHLERKEGRKTQCPTPRIRAETHEVYTNQKGGKSYKVEWLERDLYDQAKKDKSHWLWAKYRRVQAVPCGQCIECRLSYAMDRATLCMLEKKYYPEEECWFLTLTYDDLHIRTHQTVDEETGEVFQGVSLYKKDLQDFWKRVRERYKKYMIRPLKYIDCGEYGGETGRPHYHAIVFGLPLEMDQLHFYKNNDMGDRMFNHDRLTDIWGKGHVIVARVSIESCQYVTRYNLKKTLENIEDWWYGSQGKIKEYTTCSRKIGYQYFYDHWKEIYETDTVPVTKNGKLLKPPKIYDRLLSEKNPQLYEEIKRKREKSAEDQILELETHSNLSREERRQIQHEIKKSQIHNLRKEVE